MTSDPQAPIAWKEVPVQLVELMGGVSCAWIQQRSRKIEVPKLPILFNILMNPELARRMYFMLPN